MKKERIIKRKITEYYCDVCGKKEKDKFLNPWADVKYVTEDGEESYIEYNPKLVLCTEHKILLSKVMLKRVGEALSFLEDEKEIKKMLDNFELLEEE